MNRINTLKYALPAAILIITVLLHLPTLAGYDYDFQAYSLYSRLVYSGMVPYLDFFTHKPPLYFLMLLPGNWLGGHLISFFLVHLIIVGLAGLVIYRYASRLSSPAEAHIGLWAWALFLLLTVAQFMGYGNLNASIIYPVLVLNLIAFQQTLVIHKDTLARESLAGSRVFLVGLLTGAAFAIRLSLSVSLVFAILLIYLLATRLITWRSFIKSGAIYLVGFAIPVFLTLMLIGGPSRAMYEDLILFNKLYANTSRSASLVVSIVKNFAFLIFGLLKHAHILLPFALLPILVFLIEWKRYLNRRNVALLAAVLTILLPLLLIGKSGDPTILGLYSLRKFTIILLYLIVWLAALGSVLFYRPLAAFLPRVTDKIANLKFPQMYWLFFYLLAEILMVTLQGKGDRQYIVFPVFVPLVILTAFFIENIMAQLTRYLHSDFLSAHYRRLVSAGLFGLLAVGYLFSYSIHSEKISQVNPLGQMGNLISRLSSGDLATLGQDYTWQDQQLIEAIKFHAPGSTDLFTLDFIGYLYLETDKLPPIRHNFYAKLYWTYFDARPEREQELWDELKTINPRVVVIPLRVQKKGYVPEAHVPEAARDLLSRYRKLGTYPTSYGGATEVDLYVLIDEKNTLPEQ